MKGSLNLGTYAGIKVRIHWTFVLLIGFIVLTRLAAGMTPAGIGFQLLFIGVIFACVTLHEFGHALAAKAFGIQTKDITLLPIGGVARLARMPRKPWQEFVVAVAGPLVNVAIAIILAAILVPTVGVSFSLTMDLNSTNFVQQVLWTNVALVIFNMLPAFPLDGGRVLRALLAMSTDYVVATRIAAIVGQVFAGLFALLGFINPFLFLIAAFIFFGASAETRSVQVQERLRGYTVRDGMIRNFKAVPRWLAVADAMEILLSGAQRAVPVVADHQVIGMLYREDLSKVAAEVDMNITHVSEVMRSAGEPVSADDTIISLIESNRVNEVLSVVAKGELVGLFDFQVAGDLIEARAYERSERPILATLVDSRVSASGLDSYTENSKQ